MMAKYDAPPRQPKWMLRLQMFLLHHGLLGPLGRGLMIITTTGRKTGKKYSIPIGFIRDGETYLALNLGGKTNWYRNALANPNVTLEIHGQQIEACAEPVLMDTLEQVEFVLAAYKREHPAMLKRFFGLSDDAPIDELMEIGKRVVFLRFYPVT